jgi:hypothetical protein
MSTKKARTTPIYNPRPTNRSQEPNQEQALLKISPSCQHEIKEGGKNAVAREGPNFYSPESYREGTSTKESLKRNRMETKRQGGKEKEQLSAGSGSPFPLYAILIWMA